MRNQIRVNLVTQVNASAIRNEIRGGMEYIIVPSATLPADTVMNGGLYPKEERDRTYLGLNGTHAPIGHPEDADGNYISAAHPDAVARNYLIGAKNENVQIDLKRDVVLLDKAIPVAKAKETEAGRRLLDRIDSIRKGYGEPIHTSTGLFLDVEQLDEPKTNYRGERYTWIAHNMDWDHDAILLDEPGANSPDQGVGIFANGERGECYTVMVNVDQPDSDMKDGDEDDDDEKDTSLFDRLTEWLKANFAQSGQTSYNNQDPQLYDNTGDREMRDYLINKLTQMGIAVNAESTDEQLKAELDKALAANSVKAEPDGAVLDAINSLKSELAEVKTSLEANKQTELTELRANAKALKINGVTDSVIDRLEKQELVDLIAANGKPAFGINGGFGNQNQPQGVETMKAPWEAN